MCPTPGTLFRPLFEHAMFELSAPIQFFDKRARIAPAWLSFNIQFEKDLRPEHAFDLDARCGADLFQHPPALFHEDPFLPIPLTIDGCSNACEPVPFLEAIH